MNIIVAVDKNWGIGKDGKLLTHLSGDMQFFKKTTSGNIVIMGRKTLESLPNSKPLPNRRNVVITRNKTYSDDNIETMRNIEEVLEFSAANDLSEQEIFIIGGAQIYEVFLPYCDICYVTKIHEAFDADVYFPNIDKDDSFELIDESEQIEENGYNYTFCIYKRNDVRSK